MAVVSVEAALSQQERDGTKYSNVCAFNCSSSKSNIVPVTGSLAFITNERMSSFSCFWSMCLLTKSAVYSKTLVRPSLTNRGSGMILRRGISQGIPSSYGLVTLDKGLNQANEFHGLSHSIE